MGSCCERLTLRWRPLPRKGGRLSLNHIAPGRKFARCGPRASLRDAVVVQVGSFSSGRAKLKSLLNTREIYRQSLQNFPQRSSLCEPKPSVRQGPCRQAQTPSPSSRYIFLVPTKEQKAISWMGRGACRVRLRPVAPEKKYRHRTRRPASFRCFAFGEEA